MAIAHEDILKVINYYGFKECEEISSFLNHVCGGYPDDADLYWIYQKLSRCLRKNSDGSDYFLPLKFLKVTIEENLHILRNFFT
ncbi:hypothetical protein ACED16_01320 [Enterobacter hormaechei]